MLPPEGKDASEGSTKEIHIVPIRQTLPGRDEVTPISSGSSLSAVEVRQLASRGTFLLGLRTIVIRLLGLGGNVVLARLLTPRDFGVVALATSIVAVASIFTDAGMAAGLVGRRDAPRRHELETMLGLQLALAVLMAAGMAGAGLSIGGTVGGVTALMALTLPVAACRSPAAVFLERGLAYGPLAVVEVLEAMSYLACAIALVVLGAGVWGLAFGIVARAVVGSVSMNVAARTGWLVPRLGWRSIRPLLSFGARFQAVGIVTAAQDQGINTGTGIISGLPTLGVWALVMKLMQLPFALFATLWRVSYPTVARLLEAGEDPAPALERGMKAIAIGAGLLIAGLVGTAPALVPVIFGTAWSGSAAVLPWVGLALMINGPVSVASAGYLVARGNISRVLMATSVHAVVWLAVGLLLLPVLGAPGLGVGMVVGTLAAVPVLQRGLQRWGDVHVVRCLTPELGAFAVAAGAGWSVASVLGPRFLTIVYSGAVAVLAYVLVVAVADRSATREVIRMTAQAVNRSHGPGSRKGRSALRTH